MSNEEIKSPTNQKQELFGIRPVMEAIKDGKDIDKVLIQKGLQGDLSKELWDLIKSHKVAYQIVPVQKMNRLTKKNHQGVFAFMSPITFHNVGEVLMSVYEKGETPFFLMLDRVSDVRNFGAIARTAECAGVHAIILPEKGSAKINSDALKTSTGALNRIPVCREHNLKNTIQFLKDSGMKVVGCTEKTDQTVFDNSYTDPCLVIMGSEEDGISGEYLKMCDDRAMIPMTGKTESLNVSVACGIILYEAVRQRMQNK
jgi:23S rRNA (guanosine2251-2'-O)-methyltransferase